MSLENKISSLSNSISSKSRGLSNVHKFGTIYKAPSGLPDIERTAAQVDDGSKKRVNRTIPVENIEFPIVNTVQEEKSVVANESDQKPQKTTQLYKGNPSELSNQSVNSKK